MILPWSIFKPLICVVVGMPCSNFFWIRHLQFSETESDSCLCKGSEDGKHELALPAQGMNVLFFKENVDAQRFQLAHGFQQRDCIAGEALMLLVRIRSIFPARQSASNR